MKTYELCPVWSWNPCPISNFALISLFLPQGLLLPMVNYAEKGRKTSSQLENVAPQHRVKTWQSTSRTPLLRSSYQTNIPFQACVRVRGRTCKIQKSNKCRFNSSLALPEWSSSEQTNHSEKTATDCYSFSLDLLLLHLGMGCTLLPAQGPLDCPHCKFQVPSQICFVLWMLVHCTEFRLFCIDSCFACYKLSSVSEVPACCWLMNWQYKL